MQKKLVLTAAAAVIVASTMIAIAQPTPPAEPAVTLIPYEGTIQTDGVAGTGYHDFRFSIYADQSPGATAVWSELHASVAVDDGRFSVVLGEGTSEEGALDAVWALNELYLGVEVCQRSGATACALVPLSGRQRILPVPRATHAIAAGSLGQIISMSPVVPEPDPRFWILCDGRAIPPNSRLGKFMIQNGETAPVTPDLTDDRFLMGSPTGLSPDAGSLRGGHNDGHGHAFALQTGNPNANSPLASHTHNVITYSGATQMVEDSNVETVANDSLTTRTTSGPNNGNAGVAHTHPVTGTIGTSAADGDATGANLPRYQRVHYYMKIN